jgi:predicted dehydrogenase
MRSVLLCGCGNIGFRHLQALSSMDFDVDLVVVEPDTGQHDRIREQFAASGRAGARALLTDIPDGRHRFDLAVIATTASVRRSVIDAVLAAHEVPVMILEKVLFQTITDLEEVGALLEAEQVVAFVNCGRRAFEGYRSLRNSLSGRVDIVVRGSALGLASNAVHFLDLAEFLNGAQITDVDPRGLETGYREGRRPGHVEVFGTLSARLDNGARLEVTSLDTDPMSIAVHLSTSSSDIVVDELARTIRIDGSGPEPFRAQHVSEGSAVYADAILQGECALTPYADSARQHRHFIRALREHIGLSNARDEPCPVS